MGIEDEEQIWNILKKNPYAMNKLKSIASGGTMVLSDMLTEWELGIGALQSKIIRRIVKYCEADNDNNDNNTNNDKDNSNDKKDNNKNSNDDNKDPEKEQNDNAETNGNADTDKKEDK